MKYAAAEEITGTHTEENPPISGGFPVQEGSLSLLHALHKGLNRSWSVSAKCCGEL